MTHPPTDLSQLRDEVFAGLLSRRQVLKRGMALGLSAPVIAGLLAACGGDDDDDDATATEDGGSGQEATAAETEAAGDATEMATEAEGDATEMATEAEEEATEAEGEPTEEMAAERGGGGHFLGLYWQAPTILNAHISQGTKDDIASRVVLEPLVHLNIETEPVLFLAEEWPSVENGTLDPDGFWVIWKLRQGVKWHDGEDFNAEDVKFTWEYATDEATTATTQESYKPIVSIDIIDDYTVQLNYDEPNPSWFDAFVGPSGVVLPEHILNEWIGESARDAPFNLDPVGTGPYKVSEFKPGDVVLYEINEEYWDPGLPFFDTLEFKGGGDATSAARAVLETGEADWAWNLQVEPQILTQMEAGGNGEVVGYAGNSAERIYIQFANPNEEVDGARAELGTVHPIWQFLEARQALNLAIQRDVIAEQLYGDGGVPTGDPLNVPPRFKLDWPWEYDLAAAQELLDSINFPADFESTSILYQTSVNSVRQKNQEIVKADLEQLGFQVELKSVDAGVFFSSDAGNPDTWAHFYADIQMFTNGPESPYPIAWANRFRSDEIPQKSNNWQYSNAARWEDPNFDVLHDEAQVTIDEDRQVEIWTEMMTMVNENVVEVPIVWRTNVIAVNNRIADWQVSNWGTDIGGWIKYFKLNE